MKKNHYSWISGFYEIRKSKFCRAMRTTLFILFVTISQAFALGTYSQNTRLSLNLKNATIKDVLQVIENKSEFYFMYDATKVNVEQKVDIASNNMLVTEILDRVFREAGITYEINNRLIALTAGSISPEAQQSLKVSGRVSDSSGSPLPGVSVVVKGTTNGSITDGNGNYSLSNVPENATLQFSFVGMKGQEVAVENKTSINVTLVEDAIGIEEVVAVGYGTQRKVNVSGAVDAVDMDQMSNRPMINISQGLQGLVPNLNIDFPSGAPGQAANINIRGMTSINGGSPLILIDGVPSESWELNNLSPEDVSEISVLKDASSAAIYGARAAFGVILITTKTGKDEGIHISYSNNLSWSTPTALPDNITDPYIFTRLRAKASANTPWNYFKPTDEEYAWAKERSENPSGTDGVRVNPRDPGSWEYMGNKNWSKHFLSDYAFKQKHSVQVSGKTNKTNFYFSSSYDEDNGALKVGKDVFDRFTIRSKVDFELLEWLTFGNNTSYSMTQRKIPSQFNLFNIYTIVPTSWDKNPDGSWAWTDFGLYYSGAGYESAKLLDGGKSKDVMDNFQSLFTMEARFFDDAFKINSDFTIRKGYGNDNKNYSKFMIGYGPNDIREVGQNWVSLTTTYNDYYAFNIYSTFNKRIKNHNFTGLVGFNQEYYGYKWSRSQRYDGISSSLPTIELATGNTYVNESITKWALRGTFLRLNYIFQDKYILELNGRYDGSSRFPKDSRFGFFPSGSAAWRLDKEQFMQPFEHILSTLKLRGSYGSLGNQNISAFGYIPTMNLTNSNYIIDGKLAQQVSSPQLVSSNYTWEKVNTINFGIDFGLLNNKFVANFDIYQRHTTDMLTLGKQLPGVLGGSEPKENAADLKVNGWELSLNYKHNFILARKPFNFDTKFILSDDKARITKFDNPDKTLNQYYVGQRLGEIWGLENDGFFQNEEEIKNLNQSQVYISGLKIVPGSPKYVDRDGNGSIEKGYTVDNPKDLKVIGNTSPRYRYGFNINADWNGIDMRVFIQGIGKKDYYPSEYVYWGFYQQIYGNMPKILMDFYRATDESPEERARASQSYIDAGLADANIDAKYPHLQGWLAQYGTNRGLDLPQTKYLLSASYLRIKNITLGYTLPRVWTSKIKINNLRFFISGENLFEWSEIKDFLDPETAVGRGRTLSYVYPFTRTYTFGVNLNL